MRAFAQELLPTLKCKASQMIPAYRQRPVSASVYTVFNDYSEDLLKIDLEDDFVHFVDFESKDQTTKSRLDRVDLHVAWMLLAIEL